MAAIWPCWGTGFADPLWIELMTMPQDTEPVVDLGDAGDSRPSRKAGTRANWCMTAPYMRVAPYRTVLAGVWTMRTLREIIKLNEEGPLH